MTRAPASGRSPAGGHVVAHARRVQPAVGVGEIVVARRHVAEGGGPGAPQRVERRVGEADGGGAALVDEGQEGSPQGRSGAGAAYDQPAPVPEHRVAGARVGVGRHVGHLAAVRARGGAARRGRGVGADRPPPGALLPRGHGPHRRDASAGGAGVGVLGTAGTGRLTVVPHRLGRRCERSQGGAAHPRDVGLARRVVHGQLLVGVGLRGCGVPTVLGATVSRGGHHALTLGRHLGEDLRLQLGVAAPCRGVLRFALAPARAHHLRRVIGGDPVQGVYGTGACVVRPFVDEDCGPRRQRRDLLDVEGRFAASPSRARTAVHGDRLHRVVDAVALLEGGDVGRPEGLELEERHLDPDAAAALGVEAVDPVGLRRLGEGHRTTGPHAAGAGGARLRRRPGRGERARCLVLGPRAGGRVGDEVGLPAGQVGQPDHPGHRSRQVGGHRWVDGVGVGLGTRGQPHRMKLGPEGRRHRRRRTPGSDQHAVGRRGPHGQAGPGQPTPDGGHRGRRRSEAGRELARGQMVPVAGVAGGRRLLDERRQPLWVGDRQSDVDPDRSLGRQRRTHLRPRRHQGDRPGERGAGRRGPGRRCPGR